jgi:hypothetical protein
MLLNDAVRKARHQLMSVEHLLAAILDSPE